MIAVTWCGDALSVCRQQRDDEDDSEKVQRQCNMVRCGDCESETVMYEAGMAWCEAIYFEAMQYGAVRCKVIQWDVLAIVWWQWVLYEVSNAVGNAVVMNGRLIGCDGQWNGGNMAVQPKAMEVDAVRCEAMRYGTVRL